MAKAQVRWRPVLLSSGLGLAVLGAGVLGAVALDGRLPRGEALAEVDTVGEFSGGEPTLVGQPLAPPSAGVEAPAEQGASGYAGGSAYGGAEAENAYGVAGGESGNVYGFPGEEAATADIYGGAGSASGMSRAYSDAAGIEPSKAEGQAAGTISATGETGGASGGAESTLGAAGERDVGGADATSATEVGGEAAGDIVAPSATEGTPAAGAASQPDGGKEGPGDVTSVAPQPAYGYDQAVQAGDEAAAANPDVLPEPPSAQLGLPDLDPVMLVGQTISVTGVVDTVYSPNLVIINTDDLYGTIGVLVVRPRGGPATAAGEDVAVRGTLEAYDKNKVLELLGGVVNADALDNFGGEYMLVAGL